MEQKQLSEDLNLSPDYKKNLKKEFAKIIPNARKGQLDQIVSLYQNNLSRIENRVQNININPATGFISPEILEKYEKLFPGSVKMILEMTKEQMQHRHTIEKNVVNSNIKKDKRGQIFALIISIFITIAGVVIILFGENTIGFYILIGLLIALASIFITGKAFQSYQLKLSRRGLNINIGAEQNRKK